MSSAFDWFVRDVLLEAITPFEPRSVVSCVLRLVATPPGLVKSELTALKFVASALVRVVLLRLSVPSLLVVMPILASELKLDEPVLTIL